MRKLLNKEWKFCKMLPGTTIKEAEERLDDFTEVPIPHDFAIEEFSSFYEDASGWYYRELNIEPCQNKRWILYFDGIYMDSKVYINDEEVFEWKYGYTPFEVDITQKVRFGLNKVFVSVNYLNPNSRWYSGAGITRNVWIDCVNDIYIPRHGIYANAKKLNEEEWVLSIDTHVRRCDSFVMASVASCSNIGDMDSGSVSSQGSEWTKNLDISHNLIGNDQKNLLITLLSNECIQSQSDKCTYRSRYLVKSPLIWDIETPNVYTIKSSLNDYSEETVIFGFRTLTFDSNKGFFLNGRHVKLNGACEHHDFGMMGGAFYEDAMERKIITLKNMGVNALRLTHNPVDEKVLELCDRLGLMVVSEAFDMWELSKTKYDYARFFKEWYKKDVRAWVRQDRSHPCLIMWSIGNEIYDIHMGQRGREVINELSTEVKKYDPLHNAYITFGSNYMPWENAQRAAEDIEVVGYNYAENFYEQHHQEHPNWIIYGSETSSIVYSRGVYRFPFEASCMTDDDTQCSCMGNSTTSWGASSFEACACDDRDMEFSLGQFIWTGFDYLGEPTPYHTKNSYFGQIDTAGYPKDSYYMWQSVWLDINKQPVIYLSPDWDHNEGELIDVRVMSNADEVELFVNEESYGRKRLSHKAKSGRDLIANYKVPFKKGKITAVAYDENGKELVRASRVSYKDTASIVCEKSELKLYGKAYEAGSFRSYGDQLIFYDIFALDEDGNPVENASDLVNVTIRGDGELLTLDNGDSTDFTRQKSSQKRLFKGKLLLVVKKTGEGPVEVSVSRDEEKVPVRRIDLKCIDKTELTQENRTARIKTEILPLNASDRNVEFRITDIIGNESYIANIVRNDFSKDGSLEVEAIGDGVFKLRAFSKADTEEIRVISQLIFNVSGLGQANRSPYSFIPGSTYSYGIGDITNGNERGAATARGEETVLVFEKLDFGPRGSNTIRMPIFNLGNDKIDIEIYDGAWKSDDCSLICKDVYDHESIWNVYQEDTYHFDRLLKGIHTLCIRTVEKIHIKGFVCEEYNPAFLEQRAVDAVCIYGDSYKVCEERVEEIGNNVTVDFGQMDFGKAGADKVLISGRARGNRNTIHIRFTSDSGEYRNIMECEPSEEIITREFDVSNLVGKGNIELVFLPGCNYDLEWIRFVGN